MLISFYPVHMPVFDLNRDGAPDRTHETQTVNFFIHNLLPPLASFYSAIFRVSTIAITVPVFLMAKANRPEDR
jgi:hypothetical protein